MVLELQKKLSSEKKGQRNPYTLQSASLIINNIHWYGTCYN